MLIKFKIGEFGGEFGFELKWPIRVDFAIYTSYSKDIIIIITATIINGLF